MRSFPIFLLLFGILNLPIDRNVNRDMHLTHPYESTSVQDSTIYYLALGDSYSAGTSVRQGKSFPIQLADRLTKDNKKEVITQVIAKAGWRTDELLDSLNETKAQSSYDLVTLWIGVNNHYQKKPFNKYKKEFDILLKRAVKFAKGDASHVFVISIPDWGYTPFGEKDGRKNISKEIEKYNAFINKKAKEYGVKYISIVDLSRESIRDANLIAKDGLHPSGIAYKGFVERVYPIVIEGLY